MSVFSLRVHVKFKEGILDPQAEAIQQALESLEFRGVKRVECEKSFLIQIEAADKNEAIGQARKMAQELLANLVMENFEVECVA
jgi:phosphoribosylformylglycinamidine synthase PurS subunit